MPEPRAPTSRLDELLVRRGLFASRSRARDAVLRGAVGVDGVVELKPGRTVSDAAGIVVDDPAQAYVARSALKLIAALGRFSLDPDGLTALDIGASTGGFTQVLLERGAAHVVAVDVGHAQLHDSLRTDPRVTVIEGLNARDLAAAHLGGRPVEFICADVSFISLRLALPPALALAAPGAQAALLVKPQFEVGRDAVGKGGIVRNAAEAERAAGELARWLDGQAGWRVLGLTQSPIEGGDGNREFLLAARKAV